MLPRNESQIGNFFNDRSVFITGATGFMGKVLVEKLLRSCSGVKNIYVLLRNKKGLNTHQRLDELMDAKIFDRLKEENPKALNKVIGISGDISLDGLGLSDNDLKMLIKEISVVFHSAATVKFDEPLRASIEFNVLGTRRVIQFCHKLNKLMALVHVSTAYANCNRFEIDEAFYESPIKPQQVVDAMEWMSDDIINEITPKLVGDRPNTYTYTKALAETLLTQECGSLPVAIVRPSIVTAAAREPCAGWVDNMNGPTGLVLASSKGILRTMLIDSKATADLIPVDTVINLMITVAWYTATRQQNNIMIYNCTSGLLNPITWGDIERIAFPILLKYPSSEMFRYPGGYFKNNKLANEISVFFEHFIPSYLADFLSALTGGQRGKMVKIYEKLHRASKALEFFTTRQWRFKVDNVLMLCDQLRGVDKQLFHFDIRDLHWPTYWEDYILGIRKYVLKEENSTLPSARKNLQRLYYLNRIIDLFLILGIWNIFLRRTRTARVIWLFFTNLSKSIMF
ncbi:putative fatty acyl-CoA reductase CG5065 [Tetranychus urticae]|uniref:Fatty acyl-CoA reductase n=1 Tax=Tetranychus urticae TaxID=32264 RepID=T1JSH5_TETUR|nr:putative fatty acyl-CoA reductase CG5065 [Tetranychus urticae]XP_015788757.1 putative fatty acyl-CoA reductase CG5065 [Tetranychus urticae]XP_015788764.1 putative fatty acyl-CoA reductase CG5065 [Tetranychus urticae]XP_015788772.1 putative fatty acyl-CoA reductase CG5065 [Tetranychus urticae]XP_015788779.1 putative fatty acyl-CoA reductase CG5065 [Tetranychus urticae]